MGEILEKTPKFSICVPTYNRAHTLPRLINSVSNQTFRDFELVIVDDGSDDGTSEYIQRVREISDFPIYYVWQQNGGRHRAINRMPELARGELIIIFDSDDMLKPEALSRMDYYWESIEKEKRNSYAGVEGLCADERTGELIGTPYPEDVFDSDHVTNYYVLGVKGDKTRAIRREVLAEYKFPEISGERYMPPAYVWNRIALKYKYRYFNEIIAIKSYQKEGVTSKSSIYRARNPVGSRIAYWDFINTICRKFPVKKRYYFRACINYIRFSIHGRVGLKRLAAGLPSLFLLALFPIGLLLYLRDVIYIKREEREKVRRQVSS